MCLTTCTTDMDCTAGVCLAGSCGKKPIGAACLAPGDCNSGFCEQGVCCNVACGTACVSCALAGSVGTCTPIPTGQDPLNQCTAAAPMSCGLDGSCNGAGACRFFVNTTVCSAATCTGSTRTPPGTCDGAGACRMPTVSCGNYGCGTAGACRTTCGTTADCAMPSVCNGGSCGGLKGEYFDNADFTSLLVTRTDATVDFAWGQGAPPGAAAVGADVFSVRWTGKLTPRYSETYTFYVSSDDGDRLIVNNVMIINHFSIHAATPEDTGTIPLMANQAYDIKLEYYENTMDAQIHLSWSSPSQAREIIPTSRLSPAP
ncbi:MAG TPA: PA14 domain-containing protein [Polyangia bacterium]|nr:PA14 domain-containing protein [Polyangia bacterium]